MSALVGYSDSEGSDAESTLVSVPAPKEHKPKSTFTKLVDTTGPRKIKVDLPSVQADTPQGDSERPVKRAKLGGGSSGFNALLPAPKRTAENAKRSGLGSGVSLKTSSAAAFSREPVEPTASHIDTQHSHENGAATTVPDPTDTGDHADISSTPQGEVKIVGNAMRFKPLSVANKKKPKRPIYPAQTNDTSSTNVSSRSSAPAAPPTKPKVSLFSVAQAEPAETKAVPSTSQYTPLLDREEESTTGDHPAPVTSTTNPQPPPSDPNSLGAIASDLNLSASERRRLFGRGAQGAQAVNVANFNMDTEYAKNEQLRVNGEQVQHRAVRAVAPGKHSLQQLVNASSNQREALEDAWADGRRNRGEAGNKYGWGR